jgi:transcriptional regulator with XRE-family HTH domain
MAGDAVKHSLVGGKLHVYRRENSGRWQCSTYLAGRNHRVSTKTDSLALAKEFAQDWSLTLQAKARAGELKIEKSPGEAAGAFERQNTPAGAQIRTHRRRYAPPGAVGAAAHPFGEKLNLALKALSMSRGRLAVELGVDKSMVGRWARGAVRPSAENLARLTRFVARHVPGFTALDWERDLGSLVGVLGVDPDVAGIGGLRLGSAFHDDLLAEAVEATARLGATYEGFFRSTRPHGGAPGVFLHDHMMVRRGPDGLMRFDLRCDLVRVQGWVLPQRDLLIVIGAEDASGSPAFGIFNGVMSQRADVIDGLLLACSMEAGRTPTACSMVFERVGELSGDAAADDARIDELGGADPVATPASAPSVLTAHLVRDIGPAQRALGGDWLLRLPLARSIARGRGIDQRNGGFARAFSRPADAS